MNSLIDLLIDRLNGGATILTLTSQHLRCDANLIRTDGVPGPDVYLLQEAAADFAILTLENRAYFTVLTPILKPYSQRDPRWRHLVYAHELTFGQAGCLTVAVAIVLSLARYTDDPPTVAARLLDSGCYSGDLLARPNRIPDIYPRMRYDGTLRWHKVPADMERFEQELAKGPTIVEVDFNPGGSLDQHFVVAEQLTPDDDLIIVDPWDGARTKLLERYAKERWNLARAIYGMRLLRPNTAHT